MASVCHALAYVHVSTSSMPCNQVPMSADFRSNLSISMTLTYGENWRGCELRASLWLRPVEASGLKEAMVPTPGAQAVALVHRERHQDTRIISKLLWQCRVILTGDFSSQMSWSAILMSVTTKQVGRRGHNKICIDFGS